MIKIVIDVRSSKGITFAQIQEAAKALGCVVVGHKVGNYNNSHDHSVKHYYEFVSVEGRNNGR